ncbi:type II toxin-antitoxin system death-on-curing family toxin [Demequina sp. B12]|nr:type II toxin-antitoxin system death-on-curing family toxin [Demequina sp. B12]MDE0571884.1 type II toxin-antitoxin system death-on-curing family toxin [Demequina sp. B12]
MRLAPQHALRANEYLLGRSALLINQHGLESALERPFATFEGVPLHPTLISQAAALLEALCQNHPFDDGNKRTAWMLTLAFLRLNGSPLDAIDNDQAAEFVEGVVEHRYTPDEIAAWLSERSSPTQWR